MKVFRQRNYVNGRFRPWQSFVASHSPFGNIRLGRLAHLFAGGYSDCHRCKTPWVFVEGHSTSYSDSRACFPLCEKCWRDLADPAARLPYYRLLWQEWFVTADTPDYRHELLDTWPAIEEAVKAGR